MSPPPSGPPLPFAKGFAASALAACGAEALTLPLDMAKVRLQLQQTGSAVGGAASAPKYRGLLGTVATVAREEGPAALWRGLVPALHRQVVYGGLRIGLYEPVKGYTNTLFGGEGLASKVAAGLATGAAAIAVASPTDLVKVRMQAQPGRYGSALGAYATIVRTEGVRALWTGLGPNVGRNAVRVWCLSVSREGFFPQGGAGWVEGGEEERRVGPVPPRFTPRPRPLPPPPLSLSLSLSLSLFDTLLPPMHRSSTPRSWPPTTSASPPWWTRARRESPSPPTWPRAWVPASSPSAAARPSMSSRAA